MARAKVPEPPSVSMDAIAAAVLVCSADGTIVDLNDAAARLLAVDRAAALGTSLAEVRGWPGTWVTESGEPIATGPSDIASHAFSGRRVADEVVGLRGDGDAAARVWLRISAEPLVSPSGVLENVVLTLVDITTLKETRDVLEATAAELKELVRTLPDTYLYVDDADVVRRISGARQKGHGVPRALTADGVGETLWTSLPEDAAARMRKAAALTRATGKPVTAEIASVAPTTILYDEVRHVPRDDGSLLLIVRDVTDSRRAAEALRLSEEKYRTLYQRTPVMLHSIDAEGRLLSVSDRWLQRLGYSADEVLGRPSTQFLTEESQRYARQVVLPEFFATGACEDIPYQMVARDGSVVDVLLSATSERDSSGSVIRSLAVLVDVTEQRRALRDLAESDRTLQTLLANVPGLAYRCANDPDWTMQVLSDGCAQVTGYAPQELLGASAPTYGDIILTEDRDRVWRDIQAALARRAPWTITYRILTKDGRTRWVWERGVGTFDEAGALLGLDGFVSDITDLRATEEALGEREQMLSGLVSSLPGAAYRSDLLPPWRTSFLSKGFEALAGRDPAAFVAGESVWTDIVHPDDLERITGELHRDLDAGRPDTESEYRLVRGDGEIRWVIDRAVFVPGEDGRPAEMIGLLIDVTGLHDALEAQVESERRLRTTIGNIPGMVYRSQAAAPWSDELIAGGDVSVTGYSVEELTHPDFRWDRIMHPDDIPLLEEASLSAFASGRGATEYRIFARDGSERWLLDRFTLLKDEDGAPVAQEGVLLDVTDQHRVEERLRASQRELELHARIATIFLTGPAGRDVHRGPRRGARVDGGQVGVLRLPRLRRRPRRAVAGHGDLGRLPGRGQAAPVPARDLGRQHLVARAPRQAQRGPRAPGDRPRGSSPRQPRRRDADRARGRGDRSLHRRGAGHRVRRRGRPPAGEHRRVHGAHPARVARAPGGGGRSPRRGACAARVGAALPRALRRVARGRLRPGPGPRLPGLQRRLRGDVRDPGWGLPRQAGRSAHPAGRGPPGSPGGAAGQGERVRGCVRDARRPEPLADDQGRAAARRGR